VLEAGELLRIRGLTTDFATEDGVVRAVAGVDLTLRAGETVAIVGESGSGKSVACLSLMRLVQSPGRIVAGEMWLRGRDGAARDLATLPERDMRGVRGDEIAMIFQEPMTSLNPLYTIGDQIAETVSAHRGASRAQASAVALDMLRKVGIADPERRLHEYPHQMSGGMRQRVMIAMALSCEPAILIADEPTTALDVTIQAQILDLMRELKSREGGMGIIFITHNMGVVAEMADQVLVMYAGQAVEAGDVRGLFRRPRHPYTKGLLASIARPERGRGAAMRRAEMPAIPGSVPNPLDLPPGCAFAPRCGLAMDACRAAPPPLVDIGDGRQSRCLRWSEL
jgi:peptide/nickel transport system ATP-binding protein